MPISQHPAPIRVEEVHHPVNMPGYTYVDFLRESNAIENIYREPTDFEIAGLTAFVRMLHTPSVEEVEALAKTFQPDAELRDRAGMDVIVGNHTPPKGNHHIRTALLLLLTDVDRISPYTLYTTFEWLHPFTDGNGRTGRALWLRRMGGRPQSFLKSWHYQTLEEADKDIELRHWAML